MRHDARRCVVSGDAEELRTVVANLLDNAVKYSGRTVAGDRGGRGAAPDTVWVRVAGSRRRHPEEAAQAHLQPLLPRAGARLEQVKGTGLGLYIVRSIARAHGGRVFAQSEGEGRGATFTLELPRLATPTLARNRPMSRILIVEDEQHIADGLASTSRPRATRSTSPTTASRRSTLLLDASARRSMS